MLQLRTALPPPLDRSVACLWYSDGAPRPHRRERLLPMGTVDIVVKLRTDTAVRMFDADGAPIRLGGMVVAGAHARPCFLDTSRPSPTLGIHFRPGGAAPFFPLSLGELSDRHADLEAFWGHGAATLRAQLYEAPTIDAMFDLLERALLERLRSPAHYADVVAAVEALADPATPNVRSLCQATGFRSKRFIELFRRCVGLTPKLFGRVRRFQSVLDRAAHGGPVDWASVAVAGGYYDQPHLIRDFRALAGITPGAYRPVAPDRKNHVAVAS